MNQNLLTRLLSRHSKYLFIKLYMKCIIECGIIVRIGAGGGTYKLRNCKLLGILRTYLDEGHSIYAEPTVRAFMHPSGDYNKNAGEDSTQRGGR